MLISHGQSPIVNAASIMGDNLEFVGGLILFLIIFALFLFGLCFGVHKLSKVGQNFVRARRTADVSQQQQMKIWIEPKRQVYQEDQPPSYWEVAEKTNTSERY